MDRVGLCADCAHVRVVESGRGSRFYLCREPSLPKYPALPKLRCPAYVAAERPEPPEG